MSDEAARYWSVALFNAVFVIAIVVLVGTAIWITHDPYMLWALFVLYWLKPTPRQIRPKDSEANTEREVV